MENPADENVDVPVTVNPSRVHTSLALMMLGSVVGTFLVIVGLVHSESVRIWMRDISWEQNRTRESLPIFCFTHHYTDLEEWFLHEEIPAFDFSRGGVYFLGASTMKWALKPWDLPDEIRPYVHNFGFGGIKNSDQGDFLRYLVEQKDFLKAGPEKTLVVFGQNYRIVHHGRLHAGDPPGTYFREQWTRHGFYTIDDAGTIRRTPGNPVTEQLSLEYSKMTGFLRELGNLFYSQVRRKRVQNPKFYNDEWTLAMESNWREMMASELDYLKNAIKYMKQRNVKVAVMLLPIASWDSELPFQEYYQEKLKAICDAESVPMYDYRKAMKDEEFGDSDHLNPNGVEKFQRMVTGFCIEHLKTAGLLPASGGSKDAKPPSH
jgi:hypothetical protein